MKLYLDESSGPKYTIISLVCIPEMAEIYLKQVLSPKKKKTEEQAEYFEFTGGEFKFTAFMQFIHKRKKSRLKPYLLSVLRKISGINISILFAVFNNEPKKEKKSRKKGLTEKLILLALQKKRIRQGKLEKIEIVPDKNFFEFQNWVVYARICHGQIYVELRKKQSKKVPSYATIPFNQKGSSYLKELQCADLVAGAINQKYNYGNEEYLGIIESLIELGLLDLKTERHTPLYKDKLGSEALSKLKKTGNLISSGW